MIRVVTRVLILIVLVIATILGVRGVANTIQAIPSLESRILTSAGSLLGLLIIALLVVWVRPKLGETSGFKNGRKDSQIKDSQIKRLWSKIYIDPTTRFTIIVTIIISATMLLSAYYPDLVKWIDQYGLHFDNKSSQFITADDRQFFVNFIEWFGVFYGFVISGVLIKVWEQFVNVERLFDKEAEAVSVLYENLQLLSDRYMEVKVDAIESLIVYIQHVTYHYRTEHINNEYKTTGNYVLRRIRNTFYPLIRFKRNHEEENLPISELNSQLNILMDLRGDRISGSRQRMFQSFRFLSIFISIMWLLPFYLLTDESVSVIHQSLIIGVTFLVIFVLSVIEDLDDPFGGFWKISTEPWIQLRYEMGEDLIELHVSEENLSVDKEFGKPNNNLATSSRETDTTNVESRSLNGTKEPIVNAKLQVDVENSEVYKTVSSYSRDSASYLITNTNFIGSILIAVSIVIAAVVLKKRK